MKYDHKQFHEVSQTMQQYHGITEEEAIEEIIKMIKELEAEQLNKGFFITIGFVVLSLATGLALYLLGIA